MPRRIALAALALILPVAALAHDYALKDLHIDHPWSRSTAPGAPSGAAYLVLDNRGDSADTLVGASSPRAGRVEIHRHEHDGGVMRMRRVDGGVTVEPGKTVRFEPGGYHLMLMRLKAPLKAGERFPLTLRFARAGAVDVEVAVDDGKGQPASPAHHGH
ncbi:hypothetical protein EV683_10236 [Crenobacter luteus]|uniref:copper chaperone PCu(A)C n=1 Tax=Crenobacter luteus TaxID=1452487 RepID=UPI001046AFF9|nr:copper chaperone PCu(A)C [Crenobacter luteus]TCP15119.1 hypothetical protein EV683_10236 [Crenobacter luteus]